MGVMVQVVETSCCIYSVWGYLPGDTRHAEAAAACLGFMHLSVILRKCLCGTAAGRGSGRVIELSAAGSQGIIRVGRTRLARMDGRRAQQGNNAACQHFCPGENCPDSCPSSACPEACQFSSSPYVSCTFQAVGTVLEPRVSEFVSKSISGPLKRSASVSSIIPSHLDAFSACFHSQMLWGFLFLAPVLWVGKPGMGVGPLVPHWSYLS